MKQTTTEEITLTLIENLKYSGRNLPTKQSSAETKCGCQSKFLY